MQLKSQFNIKRLLLLQVLLIGLIGLLNFISFDLTKAFINQQKLTLGVVNQDDNPLINVLINSFESNDAFTTQFNLAIDDEQTIVSGFNHQTIDAYIVIPNEFTESVMGYDRQSLTLYTKAGYPTQRKLLKGVFTSYIDYVRLSNAATITLFQHLKNKGLSGDELSEINRNFSFKIVQTAMSRQSLFKTTPIDEMANAKSNTYYALMLTLALISFLLIALTAQNLKFIQRQLSARIALTRLSFVGYLASIHTAQCAVALTSVLTILFFMRVGLNFNAVKLVISAVLFALFCSNVLFTIALLSPSSEQFTMIAMPIAIVAMVISGSFAPYTLLPHHLKRLATLTPQFNAAAFVLDFPTFSYVISALYILVTIALFYLQLFLFPRKIRGQL